MLRLFISLCLLTALSATADAKLNLKINLPGGNPGEGGEEIFNNEFTSDNALERMGQIESALESFKKLTDMSRSKITQDKLQKIGNTEGDIQNIGFGNWPNTIKGTILKQEYLIKKLNYDLAQARFKLGEIKKNDLQKAEKEYKEAEAKFQKFWDSFTVYD